MIFISYSRRNEDVVLPLVKLLRASGQEVFLDVQNLEYGKDWKSQIEAAIRECDRVLVFWSSSSQGSKQVKEECELALSRGSIIVPIMLDETPLPSELEHLHGARELAAIFSTLKKMKAWRRVLWLSWLMLALILSAIMVISAMKYATGPLDDLLNALIFFSRLFVFGFMYFYILLALPFTGLLIYLQFRISRHCRMAINMLFSTPVVR